MALWKVTIDGKEELMFSKGGLKLPGDIGSSVFVVRHSYKVPYTNLGRGAISTINGKTYHMPSWTEVHSETTLDDIIIDKKPFQELFIKEKKRSWKYKSASSDKEYTVKEGKNGLHCDCWGYIAHRKCKHIKETIELI